jgi:hypothetical protein
MCLLATAHVILDAFQDPNAPKRPPSAFLNYSNLRRAELKRQNPNLKNTEISKLLGQEWKAAPASVRQPHIDKEIHERETYLKDIAAWRRQRHDEEAIVREQRIAIAEQSIISKTKVVPPVWLSSIAPSTRGTDQNIPASTFVDDKIPISTAKQNSSGPQQLIIPSPSSPLRKAKLPPFEKTSSPVNHEANNIASLSNWEREIHLEYGNEDESLIPTILPRPTTPQPHSPYAASATLRVSIGDSAIPSFPFGKRLGSSSMFDHHPCFMELSFLHKLYIRLIYAVVVVALASDAYVTGSTPPCSGTSQAPPSTLAHAKSSTTNITSDYQNLFFPGIFHEDASFDPPLLEETTHHSGSTDSGLD